MWFLAPTYKIKSHIIQLERSPSIFMCKEKRGKTNLEGGDRGIYRVVWESLQWQEPNEVEFGFWFTVWWARGSLCDRYCIPAPIPRYTENQRGPQEEAAEGQLKITCSFNPTNLFSSTSPYFQCSRCTHRGLRCTDTELKLSHSILQIQ